MDAGSIPDSGIESPTSMAEAMHKLFAAFYAENSRFILRNVAKQRPGLDGVSRAS